ncbi:hypothetical protein [Burkholderia sp. D-99]|uniref:hypothetical protein n=1 Tax=Burkholderia sp. D-99 TaxID=2717316 RepID=UPI001420C038|nr:hypothetical protein [Burkholderia sp. D-99]NHV28105.1 hypothetical protein [Burkholderia sp. D-99]
MVDFRSKAAARLAQLPLREVRRTQKTADRSRISHGYVHRRVVRAPSPDVSVPLLLAPLIVRGFLLMFIALPNGNVAFQIFPDHEFTHGYRLKTIVKQLAYSLSTASIIILDQHRVARRQTRLAECAPPCNPIFERALQSTARGFVEQGMSTAPAEGAALGEFARMAAHPASFMSVLGCFYVIVILSVSGATIALARKRVGGKFAHPISNRRWPPSSSVRATQYGLVNLHERTRQANRERERIAGDPPST